MPADTAGASEPGVDPVLRDGYEVHQAALRRGLDVLMLPRQVMMVNLPGGGPSTELSFVHGVPSTSTLSAVTFAQDRRMRRARLVEEGIPVPKGGTFSIANGVDDAKRLINKMGYPVVVKPAAGDNMVEVHTGLRDAAAVDTAIEYLRTHVDERSTYVKAAYALTLLGDPEEVDGRRTVPRSYRFLVEKQVPGIYLRFLVVDGEVASVVRCPGGGAIDTSSEGNQDVTGETHPSLTEMARSAVRAVAGLSVAAVDIVIADYGRDVATQDVWIVELSERPWLVAQAAVSESKSAAAGEAILAAHAVERSVALPTARNEVSVTMRLEGITDAVQAATDLKSAIDEYRLAGELTVIDAVEGVADGVLTGSPGDIASFAEHLLNGDVNGHRAMLVHECQMGR